MRSIEVVFGCKNLVLDVGPGENSVFFCACLFFQWDMVSTVVRSGGAAAGGRGEPSAVVFRVGHAGELFLSGDRSLLANGVGPLFRISLYGFSGAHKEG